MLFDRVLEQKRLLRVFRPAEARQSRVSKGTIIYDLTYQKGLRRLIGVRETATIDYYLRPDISKGITTTPTDNKLSDLFIIIYDLTYQKGLRRSVVTAHNGSAAILSTT